MTSPPAVVLLAQIFPSALEELDQRGGNGSWIDIVLLAGERPSLRIRNRGGSCLGALGDPGRLSTVDHERGHRDTREHGAGQRVIAHEGRVVERRVSYVVRGV